METMLAARYMGPDHIEARQVSLPKIAPGEALIQVEACGFCGSDINIVAGTHPRAQSPLTIGHELSGRIVEIADVTTALAVGDHVTSYPLISCGVCHACTHGNPHVCRQLRLFGFDVDGGMAEFVKLPVASLMKLPDDMPASIGALIEPLAVAVHGVHRARLEGVSVAAVLGAGPIGILTALVAKHMGIRDVLISDVQPARLKLATGLGLEAFAAGASLRAQIMELSNQNGADVIYECAGHPSSAKEMTALVRSRGTIVNLGVFKRPVEVDLQAINFKEVEIIGSRVYERKDFRAAIDMAMSLPLAPIISREFSLDHISEAFRLFRDGEVCKVMILPLARPQ
ncbi:Threonine dehydrogenase [Acidisarcina polymorpha]|uniref:Threonine dehydrogenase n=1 Tax=Acidisarcina polymorpha TaxID=2211140 RepID=A0A2Z5G2I0_9BACT|nr:alcohol dehydrogenase catalytic domain-containing protein [Acidisarcina polymorpha]AXC13312.1 Threonine dehydrogenase [Acidisarcina polymorpha]